MCWGLFPEEQYMFWFGFLFLFFSSLVFPFASLSFPSSSLNVNWPWLLWSFQITTSNIPFSAVTHKPDDNHRCDISKMEFVAGLPQSRRTFTVFCSPLKGAKGMKVIFMGIIILSLISLYFFSHFWNLELNTVSVRSCMRYLDTAHSVLVEKFVGVWEHLH